MVLILAAIAAIGVGVIGFRASTGYHTQQPPPQGTAIEQTSPAPPPVAPVPDPGPAKG